MMKKQKTKLDKVNYIGIGAIVTIPFLSYYIVYIMNKLLQQSGLTVWLVLTILFAFVLAVIIGFFIVPHIAYKRNENVCVGGVPFPVFYGMAVEDGCLGASVTNYWIANILYLCLLFVAIVLFAYNLIITCGLFCALFYTSIIIVPIYKLLIKVIKPYPIEFLPEE